MNVEFERGNDHICIIFGGGSVHHIFYVISAIASTSTPTVDLDLSLVDLDVDLPVDAV